MNGHTQHKQWEGLESLRRAQAQSTFERQQQEEKREFLATHSLPEPQVLIDPMTTSLASEPTRLAAERREFLATHSIPLDQRQKAQDLVSGLAPLQSEVPKSKDPDEKQPERPELEETWGPAALHWGMGAAYASSFLVSGGAATVLFAVPTAYASAAAYFGQEGVDKKFFEMKYDPQDLADRSNEAALNAADYSAKSSTLAYATVAYGATYGKGMLGI